MANARVYWRHFVDRIRSLGADNALEHAAQKQLNMNKAKRIVRRLAKRRQRQVDKQKSLEEFTVQVAQPFLDLARFEQQAGRLPAEGCGPTQRVFTQEDHKNVIALMRDTYNMLAGGTYVVPETEIIKMRVEVLKESNFNGFTRDEIRKAFSAAGVKGYRNARREELEDGFRMGAAPTLPEVTPEQQEAIARYLFNLLQDRQ